MQNNDNFFISEELLDIFDEKALIDKEEIEDLVYEITSDNLTHKCNIVKFRCKLFTEDVIVAPKNLIFKYL